MKRAALVLVGLVVLAGSANAGGMVLRPDNKWHTLVIDDAPYNVLVKLESPSGNGGDEILHLRNLTDGNVEITYDNQSRKDSSWGRNGKMGPCAPWNHREGNEANDGYWGFVGWGVYQVVITSAKLYGGGGGNSNTSGAGGGPGLRGDNSGGGGDGQFRFLNPNDDYSGTWTTGKNGYQLMGNTLGPQTAHANDGTPYRQYAFNAVVGQLIKIMMGSDDYEPLVRLFTPSGQVFESKGYPNSTTVQITAPETGRYTFRLTSKQPRAEGRFRTAVMIGGSDNSGGGGKNDGGGGNQGGGGNNYGGGGNQGGGGNNYGGGGNQGGGGNNYGGGTTLGSLRPGQVVSWGAWAVGLAPDDAKVLALSHTNGKSAAQVFFGDAQSMLLGVLYDLVLQKWYMFHLRAPAAPRNLDGVAAWVFQFPRQRSGNLATQNCRLGQFNVVFGQDAAGMTLAFRHEESGAGLRFAQDGFVLWTPPRR